MIAPARVWFASRPWEPFAFQLDTWRAYMAGQSGLVHAPTGMGKTLAVAIGPMLDALVEDKASKRAAGLRILWLTPLRALAADTAHALQDAADGLGLKWKVELRTGDTSAAAKKKQRDRLPQVLVTTPESLSVMLSYEDMAWGDGERPSPLSAARCVIVDEWHELLGTKRGVMTELGLARMRTLAPSLRTWGLSATLGNLEEARDVLLGAIARDETRPIIRGLGQRQYEMTTVLPPDIERFPWAGHLGIRLLPQVIEKIEAARSTLLFTNTRSQSEIWFRALLLAREDWMGKIAVHHGSLDKKLRARVEEAIADGSIKCCVCTSSLDLGVDFAPVDQVIQIGSPKGLARLLQRAGRSGHQPGGVSKVVCVPTNALELLEFAAAREALSGSPLLGDPEARRETGELDKDGQSGMQESSPRLRVSQQQAHIAVESRIPLALAMDVLVQHMLTLAVGGGFDAAQLLAEVRTTHAYRQLTDRHWQWCMEYVQRGGEALHAYAHFQRVTLDEATGRYRVAMPALARTHRLNIGTIMSDVSITVKFATGRSLGSVEEGFIAKMKPGDTFAFSGRLLELVRVRDMTATVRLAKRQRGQVPSWQGTRMSLSSHLADAVRVRLAEFAGADAASPTSGPEMAAVAPILRVQQRWSGLPVPGVLLIEHIRLPDGAHAFVYPLAGRLVHEGLAALCAYRFARQAPRTFTLAAGDLGFHLHCTGEFAPTESQWRDALSTEHLGEDLLACMNAAQLARRQFREVARVAGLVTQGFPGEKRSGRHVQASSELFYDVFRDFDPQNLLLDQAQREVLEKQLELDRLKRTLEAIAQHRLVLTTPRQLTPFAFPLWVDSLREQLTSEKWTDRVQRMLAQLEAQAGL